MEPRNGPGKRLPELVLITGFLVALVAPLADMFVRPSSARDTLPELRQPAPPPDMSFTPAALWYFATDFDAWWKDTFGLRDKLLFGHNWIKLFVFGVSPSAIVEFGKDDWLYYSGNNAIEVDLGLAPFTQKELDAWVRMLNARRRWLAARGIQFLVAWVPSKTILYPEHLPAGHTITGENRVDQLIHALGPTWKDDLVDFRACQFAEKRNDDPATGDYAWYRLGTHWTERGVFAGYLELMENLRKRYPEFIPRNRSAFKLVLSDDIGDSWASRLYLEDWLPQPTYEFRLQRRWRAKTLGQVGNFVRSERFVGDDPKAPRMLMFHDSMGPSMRPLLAEYFSETTAYWQFDFDLDKVEEAKPDIVIALFSDRSLAYVQPRVTAAEAGADVRDTYSRAKRLHFDVDCAVNEPRVRPQGDAELVLEDGGLATTITEAEGTLLLPRFEPVEGETPVLRIQVDAPFDTKLDVFYKTREEPAWSRKRAYQLELHRGPNEVFVELLAPGLLGDLRIRPGRSAGRFVFHAIELRSAQD
ncbi:MAG: hypothetical protein L6Q99_20865 [Planctomycetes bacterium]|nr:hypothetical protein [Planctomycetota bacterium]